jgi:hypothetical protein
MAYEFNGSNQYLTVASAPATAAPLTIAAWFRKSNTTIKNGIFLRSTANTTNSMGFYFGASSSVRGFIQAGSGTTTDFPASGSYSTNTWGHACFVESSSTNRTIYRDGGNSANNTLSRVPAGINQLEVAHFNNATTFDGQFAEVGIWNAALTAAEVESLAKGMTCDKVRPQSLVFYAPLVRDLQDLSGGLTITNNNAATVATHPRVYA